MGPDLLSGLLSTDDSTVNCLNNGVALIGQRVMVVALNVCHRQRVMVVALNVCRRQRVMVTVTTIDNAL